MHVMILAALLPEARAIARAFHLPKQFSDRHLRGEAREAGREVSVCLIGPGAKHLSIVASLKPQAIIMAGLAGALAPDLRVGDLVIQGRHKAMKNSGYKVVPGRLATAAGIVATPEEKGVLFRKTGAVAVDMETGLAEELAGTLQIPFLAVRAISDSARDTLDPALLTFIDEEGRPKVGRAMGHLARHPGKLPGLLRIQHATGTALRNLSATLVELIRAGWPDVRDEV